MPPHRGHEYLVRFACGFCDELWILVCTLPEEPIPGTLRFTWMKELFPQVHMVHIQEVNPLANREQKNSHLIWAKAVSQNLPGPVDYVFASEPYGWDFARSLGARFIPVDPARDQFPVSGTEVRNHPFRHWHYIPQRIRYWFVRHVFLDFEGFSGNDREHILQTSAMQLQTMYVPDYLEFQDAFARNAQGPELEETLALKAQASMAQALASQARCLLLHRHVPGLKLPGSWLEEGLIIRITAKDQAGDTPPGNPEPGQAWIISDRHTACHQVRDVVLDRFSQRF